MNEGCYMKKLAFSTIFFNIEKEAFQPIFEGSGFSLHLQTE